jgi:hypothetical protein
VTSRLRSESSALQSRGGIAREDIVAARRERRQKAKAARSTTSAAPQRYRKKRTDGASGVALEEPYADGEVMDPLDAQQAGLHDAALEQGHEEIALNLDPSPSSGQADPREEGTR